MKLIRVIILLAVLIGLLATSLPVYAQSTIDGDIGDVEGFGYPHLVSSFYANARYWAFYVDVTANNFCVRSSTDSTSWSSETVIRAIGVTYDDAQFSSVWFDGIYAHYALKDGVDVFYYRRFTPNVDGSLTYSAAEQTVTATGINYGLFVSVDTDGYPWAIYTNQSLSDVFVTHANTTDGTWATPAGWPQAIETSELCWANAILPLTDGKMLALYGQSVEGVYARRWDGGAWGAERITNTALANDLVSGYDDMNWSAVAQDDDVHIVLREDVTGNYVYERYDYSTNQFTDTTIISTEVSSGSGFPAICRTDLNDLYVFIEDLTDDDKIYYYKYDYYSSLWGSKIELVDETVLDGLPAIDYYLDCAYNPDYDKVGIYYVSDPQKLKYKDVAETANVATLSPTAITTTSATLRGEITSTGTGAITTRGIYYNTSPTTTGAGYTQESGTFGLGVFSFPVTDFEADELYYCQAYATNSDGTSYGEWVAWLSAIQGTGTGPDQPDEPDEGMAPPVDTEGPVNWVTDPSLRTFDSWPFSDVINAFADMVSRSFAWFLFMVFAVSLVGIALCKYTRHLGITFLALGMLLGLYIAGDAIDWWLIFPYLLVGISLIIKEQQYGWG